MTRGSLHDEGFSIYFDNNKGYYRSKKSKIKQPGHLFYYRNLNLITFSLYKDYQYLRVDYLKEHPERGIAKRMNIDKQSHQISWIELPKGKAIIDTRTGKEVSPYIAILSGYWGYTSRLPDLLPVNYHP